MRKRGRPKGTGYDDSLAIGRVFALMRMLGMSRRSAIIQVVGVDQLRRIEMKMAASSLVRNGIWRTWMTEDDGMVPTSLEDSDEVCERNGILRLSFYRPGIRLGPTQSNTLNPFADPTPEIMELMKRFVSLG